MQNIKHRVIRKSLYYAFFFGLLANSLDGAPLRKKRPLVHTFKSSLRPEKHAHNRMRCTYCNHLTRTGPEGITIFDQSFGSVKAESPRQTILHEPGKKKPRRSIRP